MRRRHATLSSAGVWVGRFGYGGSANKHAVRIEPSRETTKRKRLAVLSDDASLHRFQKAAEQREETSQLRLMEKEHCMSRASIVRLAFMGHMTVSMLKVVSVFAAKVRGEKKRTKQNGFRQLDKLHSEMQQMLASVEQQQSQHAEVGA